jgi:clan AA aspartic protease (TIGR02281 family)
MTATPPPLSFERLIRLLAVAGILCAVTVEAKFYRFVDEYGRIHFVDDLSKVPERFREDLGEYAEPFDNLTPEARELRIRQEREDAAAIEEQRRLEELESEQRRREQAIEEERRSAAQTRDKFLKQQETRVVVLGNQILVPVVLAYNGQEVEARMLLDTGASSIVLYRDLAQRLNLQPTQQGMAQVVGGRRIAAEMAELSHLTVGPFSAKNIPVLIITHDGPPVPFDGLLGMNFLRSVTYSVDYQNQVIRWQP